MKFIYLANIRIPTEKAHGLQIMTMCEAFASLGVEVELVLPRRHNTIKEDSYRYYGLKRNFKITKILCLDQAYLDFISSRFAFLVQTVSFLIFSKLYLAFKKYDVLYTREQFVGLFSSDYVLEIHTLPEKISPWHRRGWQKASKIVTITGHLKQMLVEQGIAADKISVASDGVDLNEFNIDVSSEKAREGLGLPSAKKIALYTGSFYLYGWKGVDVFLDSAKYFKDDELLVLVGGNEKEISELKSKITATNVLLIGYRPHRDIPLYLKAADVLVLPNKSGDIMSEKYTSPLKLFEYMASRRPIVASDLPSIREVLNEDSAVLVEPNKPKNLAAGIIKVLDSPDLSARICQNAFEKVGNYSWSKRAQNIINFIKPRDVQ